MTISILTLFPQMFVGPFQESIIKKAIEKNLVKIEYVNIRDFGIGTHQQVDDTLYGGGTGMALRVDVVEQAIAKVKTPKSKVLLLDARGTTFTQDKARELSKTEHLILVAGHYEGFDERIIHFVDETISIGDYVLTGGEIPSMVITDAVVRLIPGVLKPDATLLESFSETEEKLEYPQYTKPQSYKSLNVPEVLLSGNHKEIANWRKEQAKLLSKRRRLFPDS